MGLEVPVFVNDLVTTNPVSSDDISQGDDHLRNLKVALKQTFPNASRAFYFPSNLTLSTSQALTSTDAGRLVTADATSGALTVTLPSLGSSDDGWRVTVVKSDASANVVTVAGTINTLANYVIGKQYGFVTVGWNGAAYFILSFDEYMRPIAKTANYTVLTSELDAIFLISPASNTTLTLPTAIGKTGHWLLVKKVTSSANTVIVDANAAETIDGALTFAIADTQTIWIVSDGANWQIIATYGGAGSGIPAGTGADYWGNTAPAGWLECGGQAVSRTTFSALFTAIGVLHGIGDGSTTFNVPDCRGRVTAGEDDMAVGAANRITAGVSGITGTTVGAAGGTQSVTLGATQCALPAHTHFGFTVTDGNVQTSLTNSQQVAREGTFGSEKSYNLFPTATAATVGLTSSASAAASAATVLVQPTIMAKKIIKT